MKQNRKPRDKSTHLWTAYFWQRRQKYTMEKIESLNKWCWENWSTTCKRMKLEHFLTPYTKIKSVWIKDLNIRPESIKLLEENIGKTLSDIHHSRILYDPPSRILEIKAKINKWDLIKLKIFFTTKETSILLFWWLLFYRTTWNQEVWCLLLYFSFSEFLWLFGKFCDSI